MHIVDNYEIHLRIYKGFIVGRVCYHDERGIWQESQLYSLVELTTVISAWKYGTLLGSFGTMSQLAPDAAVTIKEE